MIHDCLSALELLSFFTTADMTALVYDNGNRIVATATTGQMFTWLIDHTTSLYCIVLGESL